MSIILFSYDLLLSTHLLLQTLRQSCKNLPYFGRPEKLQHFISPKCSCGGNVIILLKWQSCTFLDILKPWELKSIYSLSWGPTLWMQHLAVMAVSVMGICWEEWFLSSGSTEVSDHFMVSISKLYSTLRKISVLCGSSALSPSVSSTCFAFYFPSFSLPSFSRTI